MMMLVMEVMHECMRLMAVKQVDKRKELHSYYKRGEVTKMLELLKELKTI